VVVATVLESKPMGAVTTRGGKADSPHGCDCVGLARAD